MFPRRFLRTGTEISGTEKSWKRVKSRGGEPFRRRSGRHGIEGSGVVPRVPMPYGSRAMRVPFFGPSWPRRGTEKKRREKKGHRDVIYRSFYWRIKESRRWRPRVGNRLYLLYYYCYYGCNDGIKRYVSPAYNENVTNDYRIIISAGRRRRGRPINIHWRPG